jgi:16S rRNA (guanine966-N2)-methyltransferase
MRVIAGKWAGKNLMSPAGRVRPTTEEMRGVWMTLLHDDLEGSRILELFAGSGAVGIEALSRGAESCDFVENNPSALHALKANIASIRVKDRTRLFKKDAIPFVGRIDKVAYDIALADPPYGSRKLDRVVKQWLEKPFSKIFAFEHSPEHELPVQGKSERVGDSLVTVLRTAELTDG